MNYADYDFESLWFDIYQKVIRQNNRLNGSGLDKSQLREVATSIFIAKTQKGIVRPEDNSNGYVEIPEHTQHLVLPAPDNRPHKYNDKTLATDGQIKAIRGLLNDSRVTNKERSRIETLLSERELSKTTAGDILSYFYGNRVKKGDHWTKVSTGVLDNRQPHPVH